MEVFIAARTLETVPPWNWAYSPVQANAKRYVRRFAPLSTLFCGMIDPPIILTCLPPSTSLVTVLGFEPGTSKAMHPDICLDVPA